MNRSTNFYLTEMNICECSCKRVLLESIIGVLLLFNLILVIHVVWIHQKGERFLVSLELPSNSPMHFLFRNFALIFYFFSFDRHCGKAKVSLIAIVTD